MELTKGFHWDDQLRLGSESAGLNALLWPNYLVEESDIPEPGLEFEITQDEFVRRFPAWGIRRDTTNELVAYANAVQLHIKDLGQELPNDGWRFAIQSAVSKNKPNALCLLVANVSSAAQGLGFSRALIERAKVAARASGFKTMIGPVRPVLKHEMPDVPMEEYILKRDSKGEIYDPWIRLHTKAGGVIVNICSESVRIEATLAKWREWTSLPLNESGSLNIPQGLAPLKVDLQKNTGLYIEPNVWMRYAL
jgi:hypothetical protein